VARVSRVVFITGPSGSGKSTIAAHVAQLWPTTCVLLDFDQLRTFVRSGYAEPAYGWSAECERQWALARDIVAAAVPVYAAQSVTVVVEAYANTATSTGGKRRSARSRSRRSSCYPLWNLCWRATVNATGQRG
jgi:adenylylsulfate kinase-like enzyme